MNVWTKHEKPVLLSAVTARLAAVRFNNIQWRIKSQLQSFAPPLFHRPLSVELSHGLGWSSLSRIETLPSSASWCTDVADNSGIRARSAQQMTLPPSTYNIHLQRYTSLYRGARYCQERALVRDPMHI